MSLPDAGRIYLTGKAFLANPQQIRNNPAAFVYDGYVMCKPSQNKRKRIWSLFHYESHADETSPPPGCYNISAKVFPPPVTDNR
jgi:hypothetical protein